MKDKYPPTTLPGMGPFEKKAWDLLVEVRKYQAELAQDPCHDDHSLHWIEEARRALYQVAMFADNIDRYHKDDPKKEGEK